MILKLYAKCGSNRRGYLNLERMSQSKKTGSRRMRQRAIAGWQEAQCTYKSPNCWVLAYFKASSRGWHGQLCRLNWLHCQLSGRITGAWLKARSHLQVGMNNDHVNNTHDSQNWGYPSKGRESYWVIGHFKGKSGGFALDTWLNGQGKKGKLRMMAGFLA